MQADNETINTRKRPLREGDAETESILKIMRLHAEHRGPREIAVQGDNLARRYFRSRSYRAPQDADAINAQNTAVSRDYVCHMCGDKGHHIRMCPLKGDRSKRQTKKIKAASGIPRSWLKFINANEISQFDSVYCLPTGQLAVLKQEHSHLTLNDLSADLVCSLCSEPFKDPTLVACCGTSFCRSCIEARLGHPCPACSRRGVLHSNDLQQNTALAALGSEPQSIAPPDSSSSNFGNHQPRTLSTDVKPPLPPNLNHLVVKEEVEQLPEKKPLPLLPPQIPNRFPSSHKSLHPLHNSQSSHTSSNTSHPSKPLSPAPATTGPVVLADYASPFASLNFRPR